MSPVIRATLSADSEIGEDLTPQTLKVGGKIHTYILQKTTNANGDEDLPLADVLRRNPNLLNIHRQGFPDEEIDDFKRLYPDIEVTITDGVMRTRWVKAILKIEDPQKEKIDPATAVLRFYTEKEDMQSEWDDRWNLPRAESIPIQGCKYKISGEDEMELLADNGPDSIRVVFKLSFAGENSSITRRVLALILNRFSIHDTEDPSLEATIREEAEERKLKDTISPEKDLNNKIAEKANFISVMVDTDTPTPITIQLKELSEQGILSPSVRPETPEGRAGFAEAFGIIDQKGDRQVRAAEISRQKREKKRRLKKAAQAEAEQPDEGEFYENPSIDIMFNVKKKPSTDDWEATTQMVISEDGPFKIFKGGELLRTGSMIGATAETVNTYRTNSPAARRSGAEPSRWGGRAAAAANQVSLRLARKDQPASPAGTASAKYILAFGNAEEAENFKGKIREVGFRQPGTAYSDVVRRPRRGTGGGAEFGLAAPENRD